MHDAEEPRRHEQPRRAAGDRQDEALGQELTQQAAAARTEREAYANLALPHGRPSDEQAGDVAAADDQHEAGHHGQQRQERKQGQQQTRHAAKRMHALDRAGLDGQERLGQLRILDPQAPGERAERGRRGDVLDTRLQAADDLELRDQCGSAGRRPRPRVSTGSQTSRRTPGGASPRNPCGMTPTTWSERPPIANVRPTTLRIGSEVLAPDVVREDDGVVDRLIGRHTSGRVSAGTPSTVR